MVKIARSRTIALMLIFSFILFYSPYFLTAETEGKGNLIGIIYDKDKVTPVEGAIVKIRNVATGIVYENKTNKLGTFGIEDIEEGLYSVGIFTEDGNFNVESLVGINANEVVVITFALKPYSIGEAKKAEVKAKFVKKEKPISKIMKFFTSPVGIATIVASTAVISYGIVKLTEKEEEVSPIK